VAAVTTAAPIELSLDDARWATYAAEHPDATIFHTPAWSRAVAETYDFRAFGLGLAESGRLVGLVPVVEVAGVLRQRRWVSLPFTDVLPLLVDRSEDEAMLVQALEGARTSAGIATLDLRTAVTDAQQHEAGVQHVLALPSDPEELRAGFSTQTARNIRKAEREGLTARIGTGREDLVERYFALHVATRRRLGVPSQPRRFFERLWENVFEPGHGFVMFAERDGEAAGAAVFLTESRTLMYKYSASSPSLRQLRPNHLILWTAMQEAVARGCTELNFGRSELEHAGLRAFKSSWGAEERPLVYSRLGAAAAHGASAAGRGAAGKLAAVAIRRSPPVVCRSLGRLFYRFAA
jgi:CelD/BcsL family acetyltransferase involved in cellulose biosynthesis